MEASRTAVAPRLGAPVESDPDYLRAVFDDEVQLGHLLRWGRIDLPKDLTPNAWLWGNRGETGLSARMARTYLPRWRRDWNSAGSLVVRCGLNIQQGEQTVAVTARTGPAVVLAFADYPSQDAAIWAAMCKAAIAYLQAERVAQEAELAALRAQYAGGA